MGFQPSVPWESRRRLQWEGSAFCKVGFLTWFLRLAEAQLLPSSPPSSLIQAQQSAWVMGKRFLTLTLLHNPP